MQCLFYNMIYPAERKAQVSFSDQNLSVVRRCRRRRCRRRRCRRCRRCRCSKLLNFHLLLQNHWANLNQT